MTLPQLIAIRFQSAIPMVYPPQPEYPVVCNSAIIAYPIDAIGEAMGISCCFQYQETANICIQGRLNGANGPIIISRNSGGSPSPVNFNPNYGYYSFELGGGHGFVGFDLDLETALPQEPVMGDIGITVYWEFTTYPPVTGLEWAHFETTQHTITLTHSAPQNPWVGRRVGEFGYLPDAELFRITMDIVVRSPLHPLAAIVNHLFHNAGFQWSPVPAYVSYEVPVSGSVTEIMVRQREVSRVLDKQYGLGIQVDCVDIASMVMLMATLIGYDLKMGAICRIGPPPGQPFDINQLLAVGNIPVGPHTSFSNFTLHAVAYSSPSGAFDSEAVIFDACMGLPVDGSAEAALPPMSAPLAIGLPYDEYIQLLAVDPSQCEQSELFDDAVILFLNPPIPLDRFALLDA